MVLNRLQQVAMHVAGSPPSPHPFDPLAAAEIEKATRLVTKEHGKLAFNAVTLFEPRKKEMLAWLADPEHTKRPPRIADIVAIKKGGVVYDGLVDLEEGKIVRWESNDGVQPLVSGRARNILAALLILGRLQWRICRLSNTLLEKIRRLLSNAASSAYQRKTCTRCIVIVSSSS